jgi:poly-gamma-glutamate capsule biosynthesis protein CapA/YwtB (metallophosphatase superfamily)
VDLVVANHEGPLTSREQPQPKADTGRKRYWYRADPGSAGALKDMGIQLVSLANNHILDYGQAGLEDTIGELNARGIAHCGAGGNEEQARQPAILTVKGHRIGFVSCMQRYKIYVQERAYATSRHGGFYQLRPGKIGEDLASLESLVDLRVALVHWGRNYRPVAPRQQRLADILLASGADMIIGHHPHIPQSVDLSLGKPVFYSLGNGPLGTPGRFHSGRPPYGLVTIVEVGNTHRITTIDLHLIAVDNSVVGFRPVPAVDDEATELLWSLVTIEQGWRAIPGGLRAILPESAADLSQTELCETPGMVVPP